MLERRGRPRRAGPARRAGARGEEAVLALPEDYLLASGQRLDVERLAGVLAVRDMALLDCAAACRSVGGV